MNRRVFTKTILAGVGAAALPEFGFAQAPAKRLKIGITMLIWGAVPRTPENLEPALKDASELGYHSFETFASILEDYDKKDALGRVARQVPDSAEVGLRDGEPHTILRSARSRSRCCSAMRRS